MIYINWINSIFKRKHSGTAAYKRAHQFKLNTLTLLKRGSNNALAFGVAITLRVGYFSERGFNVFKWQ